MANLTIDVGAMTEDMTIPANTRYTGLYFKNAVSFASVITKVFVPSPPIRVPFPEPA